MSGRRSSDTAGGVLMGLAAAVLWGSQYPIAKHVYQHLDPYTLTAVRYLFAAPAFILILLLVEGRGNVRYDGNATRLGVLGVVGFAGGALLPFIGLRYATTESAALAAALQPLVMAIVLAARGAGRIDRPTIVTIIAAFGGVSLVITRGDASLLTGGSAGWGVLLVLAGQLAWVVYSIAVTSLPGWSPIRYTAMSAAPGAVAIILVSAFAATVGATHPSTAAVVATAPVLVYLVAGPAIWAVLAWNAGRARLGAQNIALFHNLVPVTTFVIVIAGGYRPRPVEVAGAIITISALVTHDLRQRRSVVASAAS